MRKLLLLACLCLWSLGSLLANNFAPPSTTYSVETNPFSTDFGNKFSYYHVNLDLGDLTRVAKNGNVRIAIDFQKGMELKETRFEKKPNGATYYVTDVLTPIFKAIVTDHAGNQLLEKNYGGLDKSLDFGNERSYSESDLAAKWLNEKDKFLQKIEFQNLDFTDLEIDIIELLEKTPIAAPVLTKAQPKRPDKVKLPTTPKSGAVSAAETARQAAKTSTIPEKASSEMPTTEEKVSEVIAEPTKSEEMVEETPPPPINEEAAAAEEEILKDPFGELKEPVVDEKLAESGRSAPPAPIDYEESSKKEKRKSSKKDKKAEMEEESITPVLSDRRNIVKLNLPNLAFGNITLNYERVLSARKTIALNVGYIRPQKPFSLLNDALDVDEVAPADFSGLTATIEYRIYGKKKGATRGFYFAPYARYANHKLGFNTDIEDNDTNADTQLSAVGLGGQIGIQWLIKDRIAIDWGILGLAAQWYNFKSTFTGNDGAEIDFDEIRAELELEVDDLPGLSNKLEFSNDETSLTAKMPFLFGGARAYLSVGYKF